MRKFKFLCDGWKDEQAFYVIADDILIACDKFSERAKEHNWNTSNVIVVDLGPALEIDKRNICDWIMRMDECEFYDLCCALSDNFEFTGEQLFYSCELCNLEHSSECEYCTDICKKVFY